MVLVVDVLVEPQAGTSLGQDGGRKQVQQCWCRRANLFDHLVGAAQHVGGTVRPGAAAMSFERTKDPLAEGVRHY